MNKAKIWIIGIWILVIILSAHYFVMHKRMRHLKYSETRHLMGTLVHADVCLESNQQSEIEEALGKVWERMNEITEQMSVFKKTSIISQINQAKGSPVKVDEAFYNLIKDSVIYSRMTEGAFDITVLPLIDLWNEKTEQGLIPTKQEIERVRRDVGYRQINLLNDYQIKLSSEKARIDLGAIAKGFAVDEAARILKENGITNFFIDAGGDLYVSGMNCRNKPWKIGVGHPQNKGEIIDIIELKDAAVTTSGDYEQFHVINGKKYSHIIDPKSGTPQQGITSASVIAPTATEADALSTALCVLDKKKGIKLINHLGKRYAGLIFSLTDENALERTESKNYQKYRLNLKDAGK